MWWLAMVFFSLCVLAFLVWACADIGSGVWLKAYCREKTSGRTVYLTFDDGPEADVTGKVLDVLERRKACATFFMIGRKIRGNESLVRRIADAGHGIGVHSYSHADMFPLYGRRRIADELERCRTMLEDVTGCRTALFRPPFGVMNPDIAAAVRKCGMKTVGWDVRSLDTTRRGRPDWADHTVERIMARVRCGSVILLHDRLDGADLLLEKLLDRLDAAGYRYDRKLPAGM